MIQIDLPIPEACDVCPLNYDFCVCRGMNEDEWERNKKDWERQVCNGEQRPEYCPLKEQEDEIRLLRLALKIVKGEGIKIE